MYYQQGLNSRCLPCTASDFERIISSADVARRVKAIRGVVAQMVGLDKTSKEWHQLHDQKSQMKKGLPAFLFMAAKVDETERMVFGEPQRAAWRKAEAIHLNGLFMVDFDDVSNPRAFYERGMRNAECGAWKAEDILLAHVTPSGRGLRIVAKAQMDKDLMENARALAAVFGGKADEACKDPSRLSFAPSKADILYLSPELFTYNNEEYDRVWRAAPPRSPQASQPLPSAGRGMATLEGDSSEEGAFHGVPYSTICAAILQSMGGEPVVGERNTRYFQMVRGYLRYICDDEPDFILRVAPDFGLSEAERRRTIASALETRRYDMPKRLRTVLQSVGITLDGEEAQKLQQSQLHFDNDAVYQRFRHFFNGPWAPVVSSVDPGTQMGAFLAAGAMFGTYLSPVKLTDFYDGNDWRLSFMVYIIGSAASGKGQFHKLNDLVMGPLRLADEQYRRMEEDYKVQVAQRETSRKEASKGALEVPMFPIRYLPGTISNAMRYRRMKNAAITWNGNILHTHCYIFESELAAKLRSEQGSWAGAQDLDCKSFSNELGGNDYANAQATNGPVEVNMNQVITGTQDAMNRKITERNCLDGLATRLVMFQMPNNEFQMLERDRACRTVEDIAFLTTVGQKLMKFRGYFSLEQKVAVPEAWQPMFGKVTSISDILYQWGVDEAARCREEEDHTADYFRRRAPVIAARYAAVDAIMRSLDNFSDGDSLYDVGRVQTTWPSVLLAYKLASYLQEAQIFFFGALVEKAEGNLHVYGNVRKKNVASKQKYDALPPTFTMDDLMKLYSSRRTAETIIYRWTTQGLLDRESSGKQVTYRKRAAAM